jgi:hypothetical protein
MCNTAALLTRPSACSAYSGRCHNQTKRGICCSKDKRRQKQNHLSLEGQAEGAGFKLLDTAVGAAGALGEKDQRVAVLEVSLAVVKHLDHLSPRSHSESPPSILTFSSPPSVCMLSPSEAGSAAGGNDDAC